MRYPALTLGALLLSTSALALDCGNLGISIENNSGHDCVLKHSTIFNGYSQNATPTVIPNGTTTPVFYLYQDGEGVAVEYDFRCDGKLAEMYSSQSYCGLSAGYVYGSSYAGNDLEVEHQEMSGSYWSSTPGYIHWRIK